MNTRPLHNPHAHEALQRILALYRYYDLAGATAIITPDEWGYGYVWETTWNAMVTDDALTPQAGMAPLGFRIRASEAALGRDRARELLTGSAFTLTALKDFGTQTQIWAQDLIKLLRKHGMQIDYRPFNGQPLPRILGMNMHAS